VLLVHLADVRRLVIIAMFSDDVLFGKLVLKRGNAISLVYTYGARGSLDVDFSIEGEFEDTADAARKITRALTDRFDAAGFIVFDCIFGPRRLTPSADNARWVATEIQFKIIERDKHRRFNGELDAIRRNATMIGPLQQRGVHDRHKQGGSSAKERRKPNWRDSRFTSTLPRKSRVTCLESMNLGKVLSSLWEGRRAP
jgi:hypothetical protein